DIEELIAAVVPEGLLLAEPLALPDPLSETEALETLRRRMAKNGRGRAFIGRGYYDTVTPLVVLRNVFENPGWYTAYTPYQAEISQGRLEALLNFQTLVCELTAMPVANASMLDEATAAAEAMALARRMARSTSDSFVVHPDVHPQTLAVLRTRAEPLHWNVLTPDTDAAFWSALQAPHFGALVQYPRSSGGVDDWSEAVNLSHAQNALLV